MNKHDAACQFEKLTGRQPDSFLYAPMIHAARMGQKSAKVILDDLLSRPMGSA